MAQAKIQSTRIDDPSKASSGWLSIVDDVFPRWRDRLGSKEAASELEALLRHSETRSAIGYFDASGKQVPSASKYPDAEFWPGRLLLVPDADGGADHLMVDYAPVYVEFELWEGGHWEGGHWEFFVRRFDVERWERLYFPIIAAPPPAPSKEPAATPKISEAAAADFTKTFFDSTEHCTMDGLEAACKAKFGSAPRPWLRKYYRAQMKTRGKSVKRGPRQKSAK